MTHEELEASMRQNIHALEARLTGSIEAVEHRLMRTIEGRDLITSRLEHQQTQAAGALHTRLSTLEKDRIQMTRTLAKLDARIEQLGQLIPAIKDLRDLMAIWSRRGGGGEE